MTEPREFTPLSVAVLTVSDTRTAADDRSGQTLQSRALAGIANRTLVVALPGSTGACRDGWSGLLSEQLDVTHRPCNLAELALGL